MEENISMYRICRKCGRKLPLSEFAKNKNCKCGRTYTCYECSKRKYHENYLRKLEKEGCKPYWENKNLISFPGEIWKPICGYEGEYDVSNFGRRKSGYFDIRRFDGIKVNKGSVNCKKLRLVEIRKTLLTERRNSGSVPPRS